METEPETAEKMAGLDPLAVRLADGDPRAPRDVVERYHAELCRYASAMLRDVSVAEDAVQEAFERAFVALGRYPEGRIRTLALRAWLYRITLNVVRNLVRDRRREMPVAEMPDGPDKRLRTASDLGTGGDREAWLDVLEALRRLPDRQRMAVTLRYVQDLPYAEISEITGWPEGTAKTLVRRGIGRLQVLLTDTDSKGGSR